MNMHWIEIPGGTVTLAAGGYLAQESVFELSAFGICRYPVTNAEFGEFVAANGYQQPDWWETVGWSARQKGGWDGPRYWHGRDWNQPDHPVVGISWYEALAYCRWQSAQTGQAIVLPTEQQWQRAAQGDDGRVYPWGGTEPDETRCNWNRQVDETTPVHQYPAGQSPFGVSDLCGNVWEWCLTGWESGVGAADGREPRLLRGGSWSSDSPLSLRVTNRSPKDPNTRLAPQYRDHVTVGFRCARLPG
jgi:formylglycine-generating enzyme required for sulfatase activity